MTTHHNAERGPWLKPGITERLEELHVATAGLSMKDIAERLNREFHAGVTRNAVIGKTRRLNLALRDPGKMPWGKKRQVKQAQPKPRPPPATPPLILPVDTPAPREASGRSGVTIYQLNDKNCHWPLGEVDARPPYFYCGKPAVREGCSWCAEHYDEAHGIRRERMVA